MRRAGRRAAGPPCRGTIHDVAAGAGPAHGRGGRGWFRRRFAGLEVPKRYQAEADPDGGSGSALTGARRPVARAARVVLGMSGVSSVMNPASRRGVGSQLAVVVVGWLVSVGGCLPAAAILGIWLSGWKAPPPDIIHGAATNPVLSSLFPILPTL